MLFFLNTIIKLLIYHNKNGHKGHYNLVNDIIANGYYIKDIYNK